MLFLMIKAMMIVLKLLKKVILRKKVAGLHMKKNI